MGRKPHPARRYFSVEGKKAVCNLCGTHSFVNSHPERLLQHILECANATEEIREVLLRRVYGSDSPWKLRRTSEGYGYEHGPLQQDEVSENEPSDERTVQMTRPWHMRNMSEEEQDRADRALARAIKASGVPPSIVESDAFHDFMALLRPTYRIPSSKTISKKMDNDGEK